MFARQFDESYAEYLAYEHESNIKIDLAIALSDIYEDVEFINTTYSEIIR